MRRALVLFTFAVATGALGQDRIASDFEIAQMKTRLAASRSFATRISAHLNLGDLYATRNDRTTAIAEYRTALDIATKGRIGARQDSDLARYGTATSLAALAQAKLGNGAEALGLAEEAARFASDSADFWNLYASAMSVLDKPGKAAAAARNAVKIAEAELALDASVARRLDLAVFQYSLASALLGAGKTSDGEALLRTVTASLRSRAFDGIRREIVRSESFEVNSTTEGDAAAYLSLLNRAQLRLASSLERRGDVRSAVEWYGNVLESRTDDATALAALARISGGESAFAAAFDANPFSLPLVRAYQRSLANSAPGTVDAATTGGAVRRALVQTHRGEMRAARATLDTLIAKFPANETLRVLRNETETRGEVPSFVVTGGAPQPGELAQLARMLADETLTPEQRAMLDRTTLRSVAVFDTATAGTPGQTILESGTIDGVPIRFSEPTIFNGVFSAGAPLRLSYRILGATAVRGSQGLLLEPLGLEVSR